MTRVAGALVALTALVAPLAAQDHAASDLTTLDGIVAELYGTISGPAGDRDWDRFHELFLPGAILLNAAPRPDTLPAPSPVGPQGYQERSAPFFSENPFYETEVARTTHRYGTVAQLWSTYESRRDPEEPPFARGINSIVVVRHAGRWWIAGIIWDSERPGSPIPEAYLPGG